MSRPASTDRPRSRLALLAVAFVLLTAASDGLSTNGARTAAPAAVNLSGVSAAQGSSLSFARSDHTHSITGVLPQTNGGLGVASLSCVTGQAVTCNGTTCSCVSGLGGVISRSFPPDSSDQLVYHLDETGTPWANSGAAGTANLATIGGTLDSVAGLFASSGGGMGRGIHYRGTANDRAQGASAVEPALPVTISVWWWPENTTSTEGLFAKLYRPDGTWTSPFISVSLAATNQTASFSVSVSGTQHIFASSTTRDPQLMPGTWNLIVGTYDGTNMRLYINGTESVNSPVAQTGAIDYGTHGPWSTGNSPTTSETKRGILDELRIANVARSASWVQSYWQTANLFE